MNALNLLTLDLLTPEENAKVEAYRAGRTEEDKVAQVVAITGCTFQEARDYLIAEEWLVDDAVKSLLGDRNMVRISIKYEGSTFVDSKWIHRDSLGLYDVGSTWASGDGSTRYVVVSH